MNGYGYRCNCGRCRSRGFMGPAVLITLGVLLMLDQLHYVQFHNTWPVLLIVIGLIKIWQTTTSTEGHLQGYGGMTPPAGNQAAPPDAGNGQVHNG